MEIEKSVLELSSFFNVIQLERLAQIGSVYILLIIKYLT